jgi:hypothetical protein
LNFSQRIKGMFESMFVSEWEKTETYSFYTAAI